MTFFGGLVTMETTKHEHKHEAHTEAEGQLITKDMTIGEVVAKYPETAEIMLGYGLHCIGCHVNPYESIEAGAMGHGMKPETIDGMIKEMNAAVEGGETNDINISEPAIRKFGELMEKE